VSARGIVLLLVGLAALVVVLLRFERERPAVHPDRGESADPVAAAPVTLASPAVDPALEPARAEGAVEATAPREDAAAREPSGPIRGRLVEDPGGAPLAVVRLVLLASPGNRVAESVLTDELGTFTSLRSFPRGPVRAWVRHPDTKVLLARHEAPFDPEASGEWLVPAPYALPVPASPPSDGECELRGRVVARDGRGLPGALVKVLPLDGAHAPGAATTDEQGEFRIDEIEPGRHRVLAQASFACSPVLELELAEGENQAGELVLPVLASPGPIRGRILAEAGPDPLGVLLLRDPRSGQELAVLADFELFGSEDDGQTPFEIRGVPPGAYELSVVSVDGRSYEPARLRVEPPCDGLEFHAGALPASAFVLVVRDEVTGAELDSAIVLGRTHGQWWGFGAGDPAFTRAFECWVAYAPGYRAARGDFARAVPIGVDEEGVELAQVEVGLARGFAQALLFKDAAGTRLVAPDFGDYFGDGLPGVQVYAGTERVAESDADGLALVDLPRAPESLHYGRPGWRVAGEREEDGIRLVQMVRE